MDATFTIRPRRRAFIPGMTARAQRNAPVRFTSSTSRNAAGESASARPAREDAGVVHEEVDRPERALVRRDEPRHVLLARDVAGDRERRAAAPRRPARARRAVRANTVTRDAARR